MERDAEGADEDRAFREVVGDRLRWGLSAADVEATPEHAATVAKVKQQEFVVEGHRYGVKRFTFRADAGQYYPSYLLAVGMGIAGVVAAATQFR